MVGNIRLSKGGLISFVNEMYADFRSASSWKKDSYWGHAAADFTINDLMELLKIIESQERRAY